MARVLGLGGIFFKSKDPAATREWYARVLGVKVENWGGAMFQPVDRGHVVWCPFKADTDYFAPSQREFMVNLMVDDLDGVLAHAGAAGVEPSGRMDDENGRFAWLMDPDGLKIELWQPVAD